MFVQGRVFVKMGCKKLARNNSLLQKFVNYRQKSFITSGPGLIGLYYPPDGVTNPQYKLLHF